MLGILKKRKKRFKELMSEWPIVNIDICIVCLDPEKTPIVGYFNQHDVLGFRRRLFAFTEVTENTSLMSLFIMFKTKEFSLI